MGQALVNRPLDRRLGWTWWTLKGSYFRIFLREVSSAFILAEVVLFMLLIHKAGQDPETYGAYREFLWHPLMVVFHLVALAFALWHTFTFFLIAPSALPSQIAGRRIPPAFIIGQQFAGLAAISLLVFLWVAWVGAT